MSSTAHLTYSLRAAHLVVALIVLLGIVCALAIAPSPASAAVVCDRVASPSGSDGNGGTVSSPFLTVQKLIGSLSSGQTGCLRGGRYGGRGTETNFSTPGVTITSYPGEQATVDGFPYVSGAGMTLSYLTFDLDKTGDPWPALCQGSISGGAQVTYGFDIEASNVTLEHSNVFVDPSIPLTNRGDGLGVGWSNAISGVVIRDNRIHDVGFCPVEEHGVYIDQATGTQVSGNWIYSIPAGTGVQVWDHAHGTQISSNVIDSTSSCIDIGSNTTDTTGTTAQHNICSNMVGVQAPYATYCQSPGPGCTGPDPGAPLFDYWGAGTPGAGNAMQNNLAFCAGTTHCSTSYGQASGVALAGNLSADPQFVDPNAQTSHDYRVAASSPAASWGLWDGDLGSSSSTATTTTTTSSSTSTSTATSTSTVDRDLDLDRDRGSGVNLDLDIDIDIDPNACPDACPDACDRSGSRGAGRTESRGRERPGDPVMGCQPGRGSCPALQRLPHRPDLLRTVGQPHHHDLHQHQ